MEITGADHVNWHVEDAERSLYFYCDLLGLEAYRESERTFVSVRVSPHFTLHLRPDAASKTPRGESDDHLALVVEGLQPETLQAQLQDVRLPIERSSKQALGVRGTGTALYVRDPDGHLIELKFYGSKSS